MRSSATPACCCSSKLFLIVFRENHCDMSVGIVNITQRKCDKDILYLLHHKLFKKMLSERLGYFYPTHSLKENDCKEKKGGTNTKNLRC